MTGPAAVLAGPGTAAGAAGPAPGRALGRHAGWLGPVAVVALILLAGVLIALLRPAPATAGYLDPGNPKAQGTRALADLLGQRGQQVTRVATAAAAQAATRGSPATLVITSPYLLTARQLAALVRGPASLVVVEPDSAALSALARSPRPGPPVRVAGAAEVQPGQPGLLAARGGRRRGRPHGRCPDARTRTGRAAQCYQVHGHPSLIRYPAGGPVGHPAGHRGTAEQRQPGQAG